MAYNHDDALSAKPTWLALPPSAALGERLIFGLVRGF
jgi:hypothetical protein